MKIAINTTSAVAGGGVTYIKNLLTYLSKINTHHQFLILTTLKGKDVFYFQHPDFTFLSFRMASGNPLLRILWEQSILPFILKKEGVDVLFSPGNICPLFSTIPNVVMIQNLAPFDDAIIDAERKIQKYRLKLLKLLTIASIKRAKKVIFISKKAIHDMKNLGLSLKHANLIYHGKNEELFHENVDLDKKQQIGNKYNLSKFILYVSNIHRYKNFFELIKAFSLICNKIDNEIKLVLVGRCFDDGYYDEMMRFIRERKFEERVLFLGEVSYEELPFLYASCLLFVYPSTCENCPNILIEAMACGAPILSSNIEPMPEMCGNAAVYFDPMNPITMADTICRTITDKNLILTLKKISLKRAENFSWENAVKNTLRVFESAV
ncbi:mannosyltransferase B-like protein [Candidatus Kuenenia stuttgartiensis]|uniref:Mannosyltransferase B-like protein n=1 Tax=Kuenenia stuttgartiensis TaxID=174633 RepID=A0A6G7GXN1_KUEST|nr:mannosyltransferase B-like protein [Candidatus Kuenenia stuttgartiensis]